MKEVAMKINWWFIPIPVLVILFWLAVGVTQWIWRTQVWRLWVLIAKNMVLDIFYERELRRLANREMLCREVSNLLNELENIRNTSENCFKDQTFKYITEHFQQLNADCQFGKQCLHRPNGVIILMLHGCCGISQNFMYRIATLVNAVEKYHS